MCQDVYIKLQISALESLHNKQKTFHGSRYE